MSAHDRGWGPPGCTRDELVVIEVPGIQLNVRREVGPLFEELVRWLSLERDKDRVPPLSSSGGYVKRYIAGTTTWSNHSWGLATDFNAATNQHAWNATEDMPEGTSEKAKSLGMRWGGDYTRRPDGMHFEFMGTPVDAALLVKSLGKVEFDVYRLAVSKATQGAVNLPKDGAWGPITDAGVNTVRGALNRKFPLGVPEAQRRVGARADGQWGPASKTQLVKTVAKLQRAWGAHPDGAWGPDTERAWKRARELYMLKG